MRFIDLFAGLGGTRIGFEQACHANGIKAQCVFTSEIKPFAVSVYQQNFSNDTVSGDITQIDPADIPDFDFLLAGFPCQAFSAAGSRKGFLDTRGTLFFDIERILKEKRPSGFLLENVEGLVNHDKDDLSKPYGRTLETILNVLEGLGYSVSWKVLNAKDFGIPQERKRIYISGLLNEDAPALDDFEKISRPLRSILEKGQEVSDTDFTKALLSHFSTQELAGKSIKDKRGGKNNIHSWDIEWKGVTSKDQRELLSILLKQRRQKKWAERKGIQWMDGMPLTFKEISSFYKHPKLQAMLDDLVEKQYLRFEHPKDLVEVQDQEGRLIKKRAYATDKEKGYNIVTGKLSFEITKILDPEGYTPTLVSTDVTRLAVPEDKGLRKLTIREGLRLFGFPEWYKIEGVSYNEAFDLLGNTVVVPVIEAVANKVLAELCARERLVA